MHNVTRVTWIVAGLIGVTAGRADAIANFQPSDLIDMPTARVLPHRVPVVTTFMTTYASAARLHTKGSQTVTVGIFDWAEAGLFLESEHEVAGAIKLRVSDEGRHMPAIAVGVQNIGGNDQISEYGTDFFYSSGQANSFYVVGSKRLTWLPDLDLTFHFGVGSGRFRGVTKTSNDVQGVFAGLEFWVTDYLRFVFEEDGADGNIGATFRMNDSFSAHLALAEFESAFNYKRSPMSVDPKVHPKVSFGMNYAFDFLRPPLSRKQAKIKQIRSQQRENAVLEAELERLRARRQDAEERIAAYKAALAKAPPIDRIESGDQ